MTHNLHLMPMNSGFNSKLVEEINSFAPLEQNLFVWNDGSQFADFRPNCKADSAMFSPEYINEHYNEWDNIFLHSLYLKRSEIVRLTKEAANRITWVVWGHDLYDIDVPPAEGISAHVKYYLKRVKKNSPKEKAKWFLVNRKIKQFKQIGIGYFYDEVCIRKRFGKTIPVVYAPYFSKDTDRSQADKLRAAHLSRPDSSEIKVLLGHCGAIFIQHEKYLKKLSAYYNEPIHIYLILSYLASESRINKLQALSRQLFSEDKVTILTDLMPRKEYYDFLTQMDIAVFPFLHQSGLGNTRRMAYMGTKLYFDPKGVLYKGFKAGGATVFDCNEIGKVPYEYFISNESTVNINAKLFDTFDYDRNVQAWKDITK